MLNTSSYWWSFQFQKWLTGATDIIMCVMLKVWWSPIGHNLKDRRTSSTKVFLFGFTLWRTLLQNKYQPVKGKQILLFSHEQTRVNLYADELPMETLEQRTQNRFLLTIKTLGQKSLHHQASPSTPRPNQAPTALRTEVGVVLRIESWHSETYFSIQEVS